MRACAPDDVHAFLAEALSPRARPWRKLRLDRADGQDALQGALVRFLAHADKLQPQSRRGWLRTAMLHEKLRLLEEEAQRRKHAPQVEAHLREQRSPFPSPDAESALRDVLGAVSVLLEQVKPDRRVVAGWCIWRLLFAEEVELEDLAEMLAIPRGTLNSQWDRAKEDMRAALDRELAKSRDRSKLAVLIAALVAVWAWFLTRGRALAGTLASGLGRRFPGLASGARPRAMLAAGAFVAWARRGVDARTRTIGTRAASACAVLPLTLLSHDPFGRAPSPSEIFAASYEAIAGEAYREASERREIDRSVVAPFLTTNAEREREWGAGRGGGIAARPGAVGTRVAAPGKLAPAGGLRVDPADEQFARGFLTRALAAIGQGELDVARDVLRAYDLAVQDGSFSSERARLGALLSAAERSR